MHRYKSRVKNLMHCVYCTVKSIITLKKNKKEYDKYVLSINNFFVKEADAVIATSWPSAYRVNKLNKDKGKKFYFKILKSGIMSNMLKKRINYH